MLFFGWYIMDATLHNTLRSSVVVFDGRRGDDDDDDDSVSPEARMSSSAAAATGRAAATTLIAFERPGLKMIQLWRATKWGLRGWKRRRRYGSIIAFGPSVRSHDNDTQPKLNYCTDGNYKWHTPNEDIIAYEALCHTYTCAFDFSN